MPRPYNLIGLEGSYGRASGLHGLGQVVNQVQQPSNALDYFTPAELAAFTTNTTPTVAPTGGGTMADLLNSVASNPNYVGSLQPTIGSWLQQNWVLLAVGLIGGLVLLGGRR